MLSDSLKTMLFMASCCTKCKDNSVVLPHKLLQKYSLIGDVLQEELRLISSDDCSVNGSFKIVHMSVYIEVH